MAGMNKLKSNCRQGTCYTEWHDGELLRWRVSTQGGEVSQAGRSQLQEDVSWISPSQERVPSMTLKTKTCLILKKRARKQLLWLVCGEEESSDERKGSEPLGPCSRVWTWMWGRRVVPECGYSQPVWKSWWLKCPDRENQAPPHFSITAPLLKNGIRMHSLPSSWEMVLCSSDTSGYYCGPAVLSKVTLHCIKWCTLCKTAFHGETPFYKYLLTSFLRMKDDFAPGWTHEWHCLQAPSMQHRLMNEYSWA